MFYKDAGAAILVYDITREVSFEELKNYDPNFECSPEALEEDKRLKEIRKKSMRIKNNVQPPPQETNEAGEKVEVTKAKQKKNCC